MSQDPDQLALRVGSGEWCQLACKQRKTASDPRAFPTDIPKLDIPAEAAPEQEEDESLEGV